MEERGKRLAVVGGGASGLAAAVAAGERAAALGAAVDVVIYERDDRVGRSILATGNGRCNFSNACPQRGDYHNATFVGEALFGLEKVYGAGAPSRARKAVRESDDAVHAFFREHGLLWREDADGRHYPHTNKASTVVDVLRASAHAVGVAEACEAQVTGLDMPRTPDGLFTLRLAGGKLERADAVIAACGGRAMDSLEIEPCGLDRLPARPVLGPLRVSDKQLRTVRELDNIRIRCTVRLVRSTEGDPAPTSWPIVAEERGELLFRKYGVSGICVFNLSRKARPGDVLLLNLLEGVRPADAEGFFYARRKLLVQRFANLRCDDLLRGVFLPRVADAVLAQAGLVGARPFAKADAPALARAASSFPLEVAGIGDEGVCQVRRGGLDVSGFDANTMRARETPGLYAAGEALDVDAACGGFNLHWAWASGLLAGISAVDELAGIGSADNGETPSRFLRAETERLPAPARLRP